MRLERGDPARETRYDADPVARARAFVAAGARALHVVDLDGAFGTGENQAALRAICAAVGVPVQTGGGIRTRADVRARLEAGAAAVVIGTLLVEQPARSARARRRVRRAHRGRHRRARRRRRDARLADRGRRQSRDDLVRAVAGWGVRRIVYTEIARDGMGAGYDVAALAHVAAWPTCRSPPAAARAR